MLCTCAMRTTLMALWFGTCLLGCVDADEDQTVTDEGKDDRSGATSAFRYDTVTKRCVNNRGTAGLNRFVSVDVVKQCTDYRGKILAYAYLQDKDVRGSVFGDNQTYGGAL